MVSGYAIKGFADALDKRDKNILMQKNLYGIGFMTYISTDMKWKYMCRTRKNPTYLQEFIQY